ncbi:MAG: NAD-dependent epimerase [Polaromonas sp.]|nr:NAD-dependent epimerase [Polaromonas sp.]
MKVLVTGCAGFIGMHVAQRLLARGDEVVGVDNLNDYYSPLLKQARLAQLTPQSNFRFQWLDIADRNSTAAFFKGKSFDRVVHLAAQAGVRHSLHNPQAYVDSNLVGFANVLEGCRQQAVAHLVYASSSSVYGGNTKMPFAETDPVDQPVSLYAATKKANELMAHSYSHLYALPATGLRFFTVYGPWGRPDMAYFLFTKAILAGTPIDVFNHGNMQRDFTYIDDIVEGVVRVLDRCAMGAAESAAPHRIFNIGNHQPVPLLAFIESLEKNLEKTVEKRLLPMQDGDVPATYADVSALKAWVGFSPDTPLAEGLAKFVAWYRTFYGGPGIDGSTFDS